MQVDLRAPEAFGGRRMSEGDRPFGLQRADHGERMARVLAHIERHLDQALDLEALAGVAYFSPCHFHRVFSDVMGETIGDYVRRRRLDNAACMLAEPSGATVLQVALSVGFGSGEAFARAFKQRFGVTPTTWRAGARLQAG